MDVQGWTETGNGIMIPPGTDYKINNEIFTPEFVDFLTNLKSTLGSEDIQKSFARKPLTQAIDQVDMISMWEGVKEPRSATGMSYDTLRAMVHRCPPVAAIITTRCNQLAAFCQTPDSEQDVGFRITTRDPEYKPDKQEQDEMRRLEDMILECGFIDEEYEREGITFDQFSRMFTRDSLTLDAACFEILPGANPVKYPVAAIMPVDAAEIRLVEPQYYHPKRSGIRNIYAVQYRRGQVITEYTADELAYGIRNPSTDHYRMSYGTSELEWLISIVTCILFGIDYNKQYFTTSSVPPGLLSIAGRMDPTQLENFKRQWTAQLKGAGNWWQTPVVSSESGVNYIKFRDSNRDMEYHQFLAFMITVACSCYNIHPEEIGMQAWAPQKATLSQPSPQSRLDASFDRGLKPLVKLLGALINKKILWRMYPDKKYVFKWINLNGTDEERDIELANKRMQAGLSLPYQEIKKADMEDHEFSKIPINNFHFQAWSMAQQQAQAEQQQEEQPEGQEGLDMPEDGDDKQETNPGEDSNEMQGPDEKNYRTFEQLRKEADQDNFKKSFDTIEVIIDD